MPLTKYFMRKMVNSLKIPSSYIQTSVNPIWTFTPRDIRSPKTKAIQGFIDQVLSPGQIRGRSKDVVEVRYRHTKKRRGVRKKRRITKNQNRFRPHKHKSEVLGRSGFSRTGQVRAEMGLWAVAHSYPQTSYKGCYFLSGQPSVWCD